MSTMRELGRDPLDGEIDFSEGELLEMNADVAGREDAARARRRRTLRVPADQVPRSQGEAPPAALATDPALPVLTPPDPGDEIVEHAFANGGVADGCVPATLELVVESDAEEAPLAIEAEPEDESADLHVPESAPVQPLDDVPTAPLPMTVHHAPSALEALARAVVTPVARPQPTASPAEEPAASAAPAQRPAADRPAPAAEGAPAPERDETPARALAGAVGAPKGRGDEAPMELDGEELEEVESAPEPAPPRKPAAAPDRPRSLTPPPVPVDKAIAAVVATQAANGQAAPAAPGTAGGAPAMPTPSPSALLAEARRDSSPHVAQAAVTPPQPATPQAAPPTGAPAPPPAAQAAPATPAAVQAPPPAPPPAAPRAAAPVAAPSLGAPELPLRTRKRRRAKQWYEEIFDDDYLRTLPYLTPRQTEREAQFVLASLGVPPGGSVLDVACGYGRHAMELAQGGYKVTGLDLSLPLLIRAADAARRASLNINFIHGDMREMTFENEFDGAYSLFTSFGYFDDDTNRKVAANMARALKPGGKLLLDVVNRDYLTRDLPTRVWWQGEGCVVLEEVDFNYFSSRLQVQRSIIFEDGRQLEQEISIRAYSLHEIGKVLHHSGFRVTEVSGGLALRGKFFGAQSRQLIVLAEKKPTP